LTRRPDQHRGLSPRLARHKKLFQTKLAGTVQDRGSKCSASDRPRQRSPCSAPAPPSLGLAEACLRLSPELMPEETQLRLHWRDLKEPVTLADPYLGYVFAPNHINRIARSHGDFAFTFTNEVS
jgi:hypothetical protein